MGQPFLLACVPGGLFDELGHVGVIPLLLLHLYLIIIIKERRMGGCACCDRKGPMDTPKQFGPLAYNNADFLKIKPVQRLFEEYDIGEVLGCKV